MASDMFLQLGTVRYHLEQRKLSDENGRELTLRPQSLEVLSLLAAHPNEIVSRDELFNTVWKTVSVTNDSLVQCISEIRRLLNDSDHRVLQTLPKRGCRLTTVSTKVLKFLSFNDEALLAPLIPLDTSTQRPAIAVMNFQNIGADQTGDVLAAGLSTDIHYNLAKMARLFVVAQASASQVQHLLPYEIGQKLGVSYLITGTTQRSANQIRATISFVETESNRVLWSEQYERPLTNFFLMQDDITLDVVTELDHCIERQEIKKAFSTPPDNLSAWELYHQGLWYCTQTNMDLASIERSSQLLKQSLALDPGFAPAYAVLSSTYLYRVFLGIETGVANHVQHALSYAYQCLEYDDQCGAGYCALGRALYIKSQHIEALAALKLSIKYKPNFSWNHYTKAMVSSHSFESDEALPAADEALRLSPVDPNRFVSLCAKTMALIRLGDYAEAAIWGTHAANEPRKHYMVYAIAALALKLAGQAGSAKKQLSKAFQLSPGFCLQNYRNALPHVDEMAPDRVLVIDTLKELGVPEKSHA